VPGKLPKRYDNTVFLNIPYDEAFRRLYLAYIVGLIHLGLNPCATLHIPGGQRRLDKILDLIGNCRYSIHDLSRVQLDSKSPRTPRFNMPFELGLAIGVQKLQRTPHEWFLFESKPYRVEKSLSDLSGTDPHIHQNSVEGVLRELGNAFVRRSANEAFSVPGMLKTYRSVSKQVEKIQQQTGAHSLFEARTFGLLCTAARVASHH
jgi:hypothetical protein